VTPRKGQRITDALGHISVRHPERPDRFFLSCSRSPELVELEDIMEYDLDSYQGRACSDWESNGVKGKVTA
jgi:hypothetical protein